MKPGAHDDARVVELKALNEELRFRLEEAEQALEAIRTGQVDTLVIDGPEGLRTFSLEGATQSYRVLIEEMNEGAATLGEDGTVLYCNACFARLLGAPLQRVMGGSIHPYIPERFRYDFQALLKQGLQSDVRQELALRSEPGDELPVYFSISSMFDDGRQVLCVVATDLREQKRTEALVAAQQALRESDARYRALFESTCDMLSVMQAVRDSAGKVVDWTYRDANEPFLRTLAIRREQLVGRMPRELTPERFLAGEEVWRKVLLTGQPCTHEFSLQGMHYIVTVVPMGAHSVVSVATDITGRKRAEDALRQSESALRELDQRKDEFLATLSHELRNPLEPIKNSLRVLERASPGSAQALRAQAVVRRQIDQLARLVDDLLDLTRVSRNKVQLKYEQIDLRDLVRRTAEDYQSLFDAAGVQLQLQLASGEVMVAADRARIAQVVGNLLSNAAKFTPRGGLTQLSLEPQPARNIVNVIVSDTGAGISPQMLARVFEPFAQADSTLDRSKGGLGLGLALVKSLVEQHQGQVSAHSDGPCMGSRFTVCLPLASQPAPRVSGPPGASGPARRVLIIEDNPDAAESLREVLELDGHQVQVAATGTEGLAMAGSFEPEVILCDIGLPGMDGYQVARALRSRATEARALLVAVSGYALPDDVQRATEAGFHGHLAKPISFAKLQTLLNELAVSQAR